MDDILGKIVDMLIAVLLLFIVPTLYMFQSQDETSRIYVLSETTKFVDSVRNLGYVSPTSYKDYKNKLKATQNLYEINLEHRHLKTTPNYLDPGNQSTFLEDFTNSYNLITNDDIVKVLFPENSVGDKYKMSAGDYFEVLVYNTNKTFATRLQEIIFQSHLSNKKIVVNYGGAIKDETD
jgi:hypothetical protein